MEEYFRTISVVTDQERAKALVNAIATDVKERGENFERSRFISLKGYDVTYHVDEYETQHINRSLWEKCFESFSGRLFRMKLKNHERFMMKWGNNDSWEAQRRVANHIFTHLRYYVVKIGKIAYLVYVEPHINL